MTIIMCSRARGGRSGSSDVNFVREYEELWKIRTSVATDDPFIVLSAPGFPVRYQPYPTDGQARCVHADCRLAGDDDGAGTLWEATAHYSTAYLVQAQYANPCDRPPRFSLGLSHYEQPVYVDNGIANGQPTGVLNLAGDPYDPPLTCPQSRLVLIASRFESVLPFAAINAYSDCVNSDTWNGCAPRTVRVSDISCGEIGYENGFQFYPVQYHFEYRRDTWDFRPLEVGYRGLECNGSGTPKPFDFGGDRPRLLKLRNATPGPNVVLVTVQPDKSKAAYGQWRVYNEQPFSALNLNIPPGQ